MPLTPLNKAYRHLPSAFTEKIVARSSNENNGKCGEERRHYTSNGVKAKRKDSPHDDTDQHQRPISSSGPYGGGRERRLTTKRSETPLAALSEGESDDNSNTNSPRNLSKERRKRESPRPTEDSFNSTWELLYRPKVSRPSPRTKCTVSLDTVDLWENSDTDNSDDDQDFDLVNGVAINPRHTVDFAELRRAKLQAAKCTKKTSARSTKLQPKETDRTTSLERESRENPKREQRPSHHTTESPSDFNTNGFRPTSKPRVRVTRKMKCIFPFRNVQTPEMLPSDDRASKLPLLDKGDAESRSLRRSKSAAGALTRPVQTGLLRESNSADQRVSRGDNSKFSCLSHTLQRHKTDFTMRIPTPPKQTAKPKEDTKESGGTSPPRKVKFNNFVTVRDGETCKTDTLRNSNNSAQMYKQQYLGHSVPVSDESENPQDSKGGKAPWRVQLVC